MYKRNMEQLKIHYPDIYEEINQYVIVEKYKLIENKDKSFNILIDNKIYLHSKYNPIREANAWVEGINLREEDTIVIFGMGLGYYLEPLFEKFHDKKIIIIEPEVDIFIQSLKIKDYSEYFYNENIVFIINKDKYTIRHLIEHYIKNNKIRSLYFAHLSIYNNIYKEYIDDVYKQLSSLVMMFEGNLFTEILSSKRWIYNILRNIKFIKKYNTVDIFKDKLKGVPVVIVSAGPSLEKNINLLNNIKKKAIIVAVGSSANILENNGVEPHIIMGVDGNKSEGNIFKNLKNHKSLLIYSNFIYYESLIDYLGNKMWLSLYSDNYMDELCEKLSIKTNKFLIGGSIANLALDFAIWLESSSIIFLGQDLCYTKEKLYADGAIHQKNINSGEKYIKEIDIYGNEVYTKKAFLNFKSWFEDYIDYNKLNKNIYNCTEGGIPIKGIPNISFQEAIDKYLTKEYDIEGELKSLSEVDVNIDTKKYEKLINKYRLESKRCLKISKRRINLLTKLENQYHIDIFNEEFDKIMNKTEELENIDFYKSFIEKTSEKYLEAITMGTYNALSDIEDPLDKKKRLLTGLKMQYENIDELLEIALAAMEEKEVGNLF
ncbi:motility associated factor glycosyltransferase family protein [Tissierella praeacuta]|uniref:motility associated factor glycosyltransferase family protein n=1 Tax=Tissierella praeacuta TaxID=43131 RepID=UPI0028AE5F01|nr:6-hydroxymethylpterin diphosphokinase MptE-like protein [Tissierella praeacuta]